MNKKLITSILTTVMTLTLFTPSVYATVDEEKELNYNLVEDAPAANASAVTYFATDYLSFRHSSSSDYYFTTVQGDPTNPNDNNAKLLYGNTNSEYAKIGNTIYNLQSYFVDNIVVDAANCKSVSTATINDVVITRTISFTTTTTTFQNALAIKYDIQNNSATAQDVSIRLLLDIMLKNNDRAPFNVPGKDSFTTQRSFTGNDVPLYWFAYDNIQNPNVVTRGNFLSNSKPSRVDFVNWRANKNISNNNWNPVINESTEIGDSAVAMYWNNNIVQPGQGTTINTNYGLDKLDSTVSGELATSILGGDNVVISPNATHGYDEYAANLIMENIGNGPLTNLHATINIPDEFANNMSLAPNEIVNRIFNYIHPSAIANSIWKINFTDSYFDRDMYYTITLIADGIEPITLKQNVTVKANLKSDVSVTLAGGDAVAVNPNADNKYDNYLVDALVKNISTYDLNNLAVSISIPEEFKNIISVVENNLTNNINSLDINATNNQKWNLKISDSFDDRVVYYYVTVKVPNVDKDFVVKQRLNIKGLTKPEEPVTPPTPEEPKNESKPTGTLPYTGAEYPNALPIAGTVLTLLGVALLRNKR